jgi:hypothetical protein
MAALVESEDNRLRTLLHSSSGMSAPKVVTVRGGLPTLVLPSRPAAYSAADLQGAGALVAHEGGGFELVNSVLVAPGATLQLSSADVAAVMMDSSTSGFSSLVTWGGTLALAGVSGQSPLTIMGWDRDAQQPAENRGSGRPYIRAVGGRLDLMNVRASSLGFWSGRTGGVAWTGVSRRASTGSAVSSTFTGNTYGAFVSRADHVRFSDDLFEANELDGLRLHRYAINSTVTASDAARNGGNGFVLSRGATSDVLRGNLAVHNRGNGFLLNGQPLVSRAPPAGSQTTASAGTVLDRNDAEANGEAGIMVEGGTGTRVERNIVCGPATGIAVRAGATGATVVGNEVRCGGRVALSIGPSVTGTTVAGNSLGQARIGMLIRNSPGVRVMNNRFAGMTIFAISVRGSSPGVVGNGNVLAGEGFRPIDTRSGAPEPLMTTSDSSGWQRRSELTVPGYLRYHPILTTWVGIVILVFASSILARRRTRPSLPYSYYLVPHATEPAAVRALAGDWQARDPVPGRG